MTDNEIRRIILTALYDEYRRVPGVGQKTMDEIAEQFKIEPDAMEFNAHFLVDHEFITFAAMGGMLQITPKGLAWVEGPSEFNPPQTYISQSIEISGGQVGQILQAHTITDPSRFLNRLGEAVERHPGLERSQGKRWKEVLLEMSRHPVLLEILRTVGSFLRG